jgi:Amt family ammonium transporter
MAAYVSMSSALAVGAIGGTICYAMYQVIHKKFKFDDALDVFAVHGVGGIFGTIMTAFFVQTAYGAGADGLFFGGSADLLIGNAVAVVVVAVFCFAVTYALMFIVDKIIPGKITPEEEEKGQDILEHDEVAYN